MGLDIEWSLLHQFLHDVFFQVDILTIEEGCVVDEIYLGDEFARIVLKSVDAFFLAFNVEELALKLLWRNNLLHSLLRIDFLKQGELPVTRLRQQKLFVVLDSDVSGKALLGVGYLGEVGSLSFNGEVLYVLECAQVEFSLFVGFQNLFLRLSEKLGFEEYLQKDIGVTLSISPNSTQNELLFLVLGEISGVGLSRRSDGDGV